MKRIKLSGAKRREEMESKRLRAFDLPRITIEDKYDYDKDKILKEQIDSPVILTSYRTKGGESRLLFTGFGEPEFTLFVSQVHRLIPFYEFVKSAVQNIDRARLGSLEQQIHMMESIKYLNLKNQSL
jgi:hypothetical protein